MTDGQVTPAGDQVVEPTVVTEPSLGWRAGLPDEFKEHDWAKTHGKVGDFFKDALQVKTEHDSLKTKLDGAIFKPGEKATEAEVAEYRKALGIPEKADDYEFPAGEGVAHDEKMIGWARGVFHQAGLSKEQGMAISQAWDGFVQGMANERAEAAQAGFKEAESKLKTEWGSAYDTNLEITRRAYAKLGEKVPGLGAFLSETVVGDKTVGNHPVMIAAFHLLGQAMGEDTSPPGGGSSDGAIKEQFVYDKSPAPPGK